MWQFDSFMSATSAVQRCPARMGGRAGVVAAATPAARPSLGPVEAATRARLGSFSSESGIVRRIESISSMTETATPAICCANHYGSTNVLDRAHNSTGSSTRDWCAFGNHSGKPCRFHNTEIFANDLRICATRVAACMLLSSALSVGVQQW